MPPPLPPAAPGASYLPADHPLSRQATALRDELLAAAAALIEEQHGPESAELAGFQQQLASFLGGTVPLRVYRGGPEGMAGGAGFGGIIIRDTSLARSTAQAVHTVGHELGHILCRHHDEAEHEAQSTTAATRSWALCAAGFAAWGVGGMPGPLRVANGLVRAVASGRIIREASGKCEQHSACPAAGTASAPLP